MWTTLLGIIAAALTSLSYLPQAFKASRPASTDDLSLRMLVTLLGGLCLWIVYGVARDDPVIIIANAVGAALVGFVCACKLRDMRS